MQMGNSICGSGSVHTSTLFRVYIRRSDAAGFDGYVVVRPVRVYGMGIDLGIACKISLTL